MRKPSRVFLAVVLFIVTISPMYAEERTIHAFLETIVRQPYGQEKFCEEYARLTGTKLLITQYPNARYVEMFHRNLISDHPADIVEIPWGFYRVFADEEYFIPLNKFIQHSEVAGKIDSRHFEALKVNGKIYGFPIHEGSGYVTYTRKDWLDNLGMKVPTTWDELFEVMKAFTYNDPDQNGQHDTKAYALPSFVAGTVNWTDFYQGATHEFTKVNNQWVDGFVQPEFKEALLRIKKAYDANVLDRQVHLYQAREKFFRGEVGIINDRADTTAVEKLKLLEKAHPNVKITVLPPIKGSTYWNYSSTTLAIPKKTKNPEFVFKKFIELMYDGGRGQMLFTHGVQGVHYKIENGEYQKLFNTSEYYKDKLFTYTLIPPELVLNPWNDPFPVDPLLSEARRVFRINFKYFDFSPRSQKYPKYISEIEELKIDIMNKVMTSQYTVDEGLTIYREKAKMLFVDQILEEFNCSK